MDTFEYIRTLAKFRSELVQPASWVRITTITMMAKDVLGSIDVKAIREYFKTRKVKVIAKGSVKGFEWIVRPPKRGNQFYNCISIGYTDVYSTKSVKLFSNGSIHVTGCSNVLDCKRVVAQLAVVLPRILNKSIDIHYDLFKIVMINTNFSLNKTLNLYSVLKDMQKNPEGTEVEPHVSLQSGRPSHPLPMGKTYRLIYHMH